MNPSIKRRLLRVAKQIEQLDKMADVGPSGGSRTIGLAKEALNEAVSYVDSIAKGLMSYKKEARDQNESDVADDMLKEISIARKHLTNAGNIS